MGMRIMSSSSFDKGCNGNCNCSSEDKIPNPDPENYEYIRHVLIDNYLILELHYPDCTNYEGTKILVFDKGVTFKQLTKQVAIDPHFSDNDSKISPIARFVPTEKGFEMAISFVRSLK